MKSYLFDLMALIGNEILISIKDYNFVTNVRKMTHNNPYQDLVNLNAYTKLSTLLSVCSHYDRKSDIYQ